ncbi:two-component regulator propeller domain-containing protein [Flavobacterium sp. RHBU_3]|uniref:hybrid sensor histidine kinase/response regulator transcription factor n=1 Tax=Flavobacterium sp. RHBU_3 TaxID=3391184 RepID=UPI0039846422
MLRAQVYPVTFYDIAQGLSNNSVLTLHQDTNGFMWIGTYDGLNRYDGYEFKVYRNRLGDESSLISNNVYSLSGDNQNNIWIGTSKGGCVLNQATEIFTPLQFVSGGKKKQLDGDVHQIKNFGKYGMLAGTQQYGLIYFNENSPLGTPVALQKNGKSVYNYDVVALQPVSDKGFSWVFVRNTGLCRFDIKKKQLTPELFTNVRANCMLSDKNGLLWIGTDEGLFSYNAVNKKLSGNYLPKTSVTNLLQDNRLLMIATDGGGLFALEQGATEAVSYNTINSQTVIKSNVVYGLYKDRSGNKWIGSLRGGISVIGANPTSFSTITYKGNDTNTLAENFILSFCEDEKKNLWIGTDGAGLRYWNRNTNTYTNYNKTLGSKYKLTSNFITGLMHDEANRIWISTWKGGVNRINPSTGTIEYFNCYNPVTKQNERNIWLVFEDSRKHVWASATNEGCLYRFNTGSNAFEIFDPKIKNLQCLAETADGKLWGGNYTSLYCIDVTTRKHKAYEIGYPVRSVLEDSKHRLWVGTQEGGLLLFDRNTGKYKRFSTNEGLPGNTILRLLEDKDGDLWMSTYNGLSRYDADAGLFMNFSVNDGLQSNQFSFNAALKLSSGEFLFGGIRGFNSFRPERIKESKPENNILLAGLSINNKAIEKSLDFVEGTKQGQIREIKIPFDQTTLSIDFVEPDFNNSDKVSYAYFLEGWDEHWNYVGNSRRANYTRLIEGDYVFKVKTKNINGTWNTPASLLYITVLPPWYRSWWAYILYAAMAMGIIYAYIRYNKNKEQMRYKVKLAQLESRKEKEMAEKQMEMFTYISHEFRTPLSLIINPLRRAVKKPLDENPDLSNDLAVAHRNSRRLLSLVDQLLLFRKAESDADMLKISAINLNHLCNEVYQCFVNQAREQGIDFVLDIPKKKTEIFGDYEKIEIALFNLTSNAFKHTTNGGTITFKLVAHNSHAEVSISDTGCGINEADLPHIFEKFRRVNSKPVAGSGFGIGLFVVKHFTEKHHGNVSCHSVQGQGSIFTLSFLKGYEHFADMPISAISPKMSELVEELLGDAIAASDEIPVKDTVPLPEKEIVTDKKSVLIVDDNVEIRSYLSNLFSASYIVFTAENGVSGYETAKNKRPDIIISDISMDEMDGLELCRKIKETPELNHLPVILLTATSSPEIHLKGISEGADDYITKPFDSDILLARVETLLKSRNNLKSYFLDGITSRDDNKVPAEYRDFIKKCIDIIEVNLDNADFNIKTFAQQMGMSHRSLYDKIKLITGQTLNAFIRSVRLRRAALLMLTENMNIAQAAIQVGFEDQQYFRQQFVKLFGMTPSEYIKRYKDSFNRDHNIVK